MAAAIHFVSGTDEFEVKRVAAELAQKLTPPGDMTLETLDGAADNVEGAVRMLMRANEALVTFPFFGGEKLVWLKNLNCLEDSQIGRSDRVLEGLEEIAQTLQTGLAPGTSVLISALNPDKRRSAYKTLLKLADAQIFDRLDTSKAGWEDAAANLAVQTARQRGLRFAEDALSLFVLCTGGEKRITQTELEKLDLYLGKARRQIELADIDLLVARSHASVIWDLGNAISQRDTRRALVLLERLLADGENAVGILLVAIIPTVRNLLLVKDLLTRHKLAPPAKAYAFNTTLEGLGAAAIAHLPRKKDGTLNAYPLGLAAASSRRFTVPELETALHACLDANEKIVSSGLSTRVVLSELLVRITAPSKP